MNYDGEYKKYNTYLKLFVYDDIINIINEFCGVKHGYGIVKYTWTFSAFLNYLVTIDKDRRFRHDRKRVIWEYDESDPNIFGEVFDAVFQGRFKNDFPHYGTMIYHNGDRYEGQWKKLCYHGQGREEKKEVNGSWMINNTVNEGKFKNGELVYGRSKFYGDIYEGYFKKGLLHGLGRKIYHNGDIYEGMWKKGNISTGRIKYRNMYSCYIYIGEFGKYDNPEGKGIMIYRNGNYYCGNWQKGLKHGPGKMHENKIIYEGEWVYGELYKGTITYQNGNKYIGEWDSKYIRQGQGKEICTNGYSYNGGWVSGNKHGYGKEKLSCGTTYEGCWENNKKHGLGIVRLTNGVFLRGRWDNDKNISGIWSHKNYLPVYKNIQLILKRSYSGYIMFFKEISDCLKDESKMFKECFEDYKKRLEELGKQYFLSNLVITNYKKFTKFTKSYLSIDFTKFITKFITIYIVSHAVLHLLVYLIKLI